GLGTLTLLVGLPVGDGAALLVGSSLVLLVIFARIYKLRPESSTILMMVGAGAWFIGNTLWLGGRPIVACAPWWAGFLVLTIVGERLELAQVMLPVKTRSLLLVAVTIVIAGLALTMATFAGDV